MSGSDLFVRRIVIVGGGTAGWMTAAALGRTLQNHPCQVTVVESPDISSVGVGEATIPPIQLYNRMLKLDENEFLKATQGTFKLGIDFINWRRKGHSYFHPFGRYGADIDAVPFHHYWHKMNSLGEDNDLLQYSLPSVAALKGRFAPPDPNPRSVLSNMAHAYHFDAGLYAKFLQTYALERGVEHIQSNVQGVELNPDNGFIDAIRLEDSARLEADFFVDCTGFKGLLIEEALHTGYENWQHYLPCDRAVAVPCEQPGPPLPYTKSMAHSAGWQWRIPLQHRLGNGHVYCSEYMSDDEATATLMNNLDGEPLAEPKHLRFVTGRRKQFWNKNCLAIGLSAGFMEPLESTSIHLIQTAIAKLMTVFPDRAFDPVDIAEYNRLTTTEFIRIRDFLVLHYMATERDDSPLWNYTRNMSIPDTLQHKLDLYRSRGRVFRYDEELFADTSWVAVFEGQGIEPRRYDPLVDTYDIDRLRAVMAKMRKTIAAGAESLPTHEQYIARHCAAN
ncbi:tryptophan 7-halogenase [Gilvimarinus sp. SDUM040013]|uniref:Tryptophan halogenase family protein n=1 Tax=Gilvimarinus gilvus TaxID=3058038 RepID=A0ABU4RX98_9GAMM|nr:tryptophan halogenase family protein [Gilvimarinus sp. SDUM040013]MDO3387752.1 tryptophan 7-halogenase [Gilvimarinus sp. SDUM040013]MDX6848807.1 tryptophan halogenase family protein [Gilvimarinus sp. SDUM040013]